MKKNRVICIALIILLLCCNIKISLAGVEEGTFGVDEFQYDLEIIKTANNYLLDSEGRLWKTSRAGLTHMFKDLTFSDIDTNNVAGHFLALDTEGYLWSWGKNTYGQLGIGSTEDSDIPVGVYQTKKFSSISAGSTSSYAIDIDGNLYAWGSNKFKQVGGSNSSYEYSDSVSIPIQLSPRKLLDGYKFQKVAAGNDNVIMLDTDGYVWGLGYDNDYDVGSSNRTKVYYDIGWNGNYWYAITTPTKISDTNTYKDISKGIQHSIMISTEGKVYTLGDGDYGQLGNGSLVDYIATPTIPLGFEDVIIKDIAAGEKTSAFLDENNTLWMTGDNSYGTLGNGTKTDTSTAIKLRGLNVESISLEHYYQKIFVNDIEGNLWGWGTNLAYDIGVSDDLYENGGSTIMTTSPLQITAKRIYYTVTFMDGTTTVDTQTVTKGESATAPNLTKTGYTLSWDTDFSNVTSDLIVNAIWTANTNTPYKVEHYQRTTDLEVEGYTLFETENKTGTTDAMAVAVAKSYSGFTENTTHTNRVATGTVVGNGSLVLKLYYDRNTYNITYELNGGTATGTLTQTYLYGKELMLSNKIEKTGYTFVGWYDNQGLTGNQVVSIKATETGDKTFYAKWVKEDEYNITSVKYQIQDSYITKVSPDTSVDTFLSNINTNGIPKVFDTQGNEITGSTLVGTGSVLKVEFKGTKHEYVIAVRGDIDGNGKITVTDLSMLNQQIVKKITLTGAKEKAADIDYSGKTTVTDLSMMNQALVGKIKL